MKKVKITKEFLESLGFTHCTDDGQLYKGNFPVKYQKVWAKHKYGKDKYYLVFSYYDAEFYKTQMEKYRNGEVTKCPSGIKVMLVSRAIYAWFYGETPDELDICHLDDDPDNNCISNLKAMTHGENIRNRKIQGSRYTNYYTVNGLTKENQNESE